MEKKQTLINLFEFLRGINGVSVNTINGSVIIHYDPDMLNRDDILGILQLHRFVDKHHVISNDNRMDRFIETIRKEIRKAMFTMAFELALEPVGLSFVCALI
ncbi:MAG: hypothetical protein OMM_11117 [Candidatus Magnetoglobus multicellularis str. Araruama]|uniref:HMA domain-containing protein n=1 Tax=Candidatus Magnetoglobus multicellularis str. Araruama TaxID=890399 RepID=A0A1V1NZ49_9BACT|nr:MAG: hypothetical protein OMM_11117 [Candidatus Magnetoglobus multicellularis str. Araruama]